MCPSSLGQQPLQGDFVVRLFALSQCIICATPAYLARRGPLKEPEDLLQHDGLLPDVAAVRRELTLFPAEYDTDLEIRKILWLNLQSPTLSTSQLEVLYVAALAGMGVTGLPTFMVADAIRDGRLQRVLPAWHGGALQLYAAMPTRKNVPARTRAFVDFLVETFGGKQEDPWLSTLQT